MQYMKSRLGGESEIAKLGVADCKRQGDYYSDLATEYIVHTQTTKAGYCRAENNVMTHIYSITHHPLLTKYYVTYPEVYEDSVLHNYIVCCPTYTYPWAV